MTIALGFTNAKNEKIVMTDTAICVEINDKYYRVGNYLDKAFIQGDKLIFCSGNMEIASKVKDYINGIIDIDKNIDNIRLYAKKLYDNYHSNNWVWIVDKYNFFEFGSPDFKLKNQINDNKIHLSFEGHFEKNGKLLAEEQVLPVLAKFIEQHIYHEKQIIDCMLEVAKYYNCEAVGGTMLFYKLKNNCFELIKKVKVDNIRCHTIQELHKCGNIKLGGNVTWLTHDPLIGDAIDLAGNAKDKAMDVSKFLTKLADGTYTGGTFINGTTISSPNIEGGIIAGGEFCDLNKKAKLVLNPTNSTSKNADLNLYSGENVALRVYDNIAGSVDISSYSNLVMTTGINGTYAKGKWDFSSAEVTGIDNVAKFA